MTSPVAMPVGKGSASSTTSRRRSSAATKMPRHADRRAEDDDRPCSEKCVPISASAGIGPTTPVTKLMTAADDAVVWVMLFSSAL